MIGVAVFLAILAGVAIGRLVTLREFPLAVPAREAMRRGSRPCYLCEGAGYINDVTAEHMAERGF